MIEFENIDEAMQWVFDRNMPEFALFDRMAPQREKRTWDIKQKLTGGTFGRVFAEYAVSQRQAQLGLQFSASLFPECPIPAGPFGYDLDLLDCVNNSLHIKLMRYFYGGGWLEIPENLNTDTEILQLIGAALRNDVQLKMKEWADQLRNDALLSAAMEVYHQVEKMCEEDRESRLQAFLAQNANMQSRHYPLKKIVRQMTFRLKGNPNWHIL